MVEDLGLGPGHILYGFEKFQMHGKHVEDHRRIRFQDACQPADLADAGIAHRQLEHRRLLVTAHLQQRKRQAQPVVPVDRRTERPEPMGQQLEDEFLGGGLARTARDADEPTAAELLAHVSGQPLRRLQRIGHTDQGKIQAGGRGLVGDDRCHPRQGGQLRQVAVAIIFFRTDGKKEGIGLQLAGVEVESPHHQPRLRVLELAGHGPGDLFQRQLSHGASRPSPAGPGGR